MKKSTISALILLFAIYLYGQNIVKNGDFSSSDTNWQLGDYHDVADGNVLNGEYQIRVSTPQQENWAVQLMQNDINLSQNKTYTLSFDAYADADKTIIAAVGGVSGDMAIDISTVKQNYSFSFSSVKSKTIVSRLDFNIGKTVGYVTLDNVIIKEFKPTPDTLNLPIKDCRFPTCSIYPHGIKPNNFSQFKMNEHCRAWFNKWKAKYLTQQGCNQGEYRIQRIETGDDNTHDSVSEGIAYGMIIMVYMHNDTNNTKPYFDGLWKYYCRYKNDNNLMTWRIYKNGTIHNPGGAATDADVDAAFALYMAYRQWGGSGTTNYFEEATSLAGSILQHEITEQNDVRPGDSWDIGNPSYFTPAYFSIYGRLTGLTRWESVAKQTYTTIVDHYYTSDETYSDEFKMYTGLMPNWCKYEGGEQGPGEWAMDHTSFWWDACRFPLRLGYDYLLHGQKNSKYAKTNTARISKFFKAKYDSAPSKIKSHYTLDGKESVWSGNPNPHLGTEDTMNLAGFVGSIAISAMVDEDQQWLDTLYRQLVAIPMCETGVDWGTDYFCDILKMLYLLVLSGNMPDLYTDFEVDTVVAIKNLERHNTGPQMLQVKQSQLSKDITVIFSLPQRTDVSICLFNLKGNHIKSLLSNNTVMSGKHEYTFDCSAIASGIYFVSLNAGKKVYTRKLVQVW